MDVFFETVEWSMLILTRRVGETLVIGDNVKITVLGVKGNQVRVGVDAPKEVSIQRAELFENAQEQNPALEHPNHRNNNVKELIG